MRRAVLGLTLIALVCGVVYAQTGQVAIQNWKGTLADANCAAGSGSTASTPAADQSQKAPDQAAGTEQGATADQPSKKWHRDKNASQVQSCPVTTSTTTFALMTADGKTLKIDSIGNMRVAEELKTKQKWVKDVNEGKPVHASISGTMDGDVITVTSIH